MRVVPALLPAGAPPAPVILTAMAELTTAQYDALERAIADRLRISVYRRGTEFVVVPRRLRTSGGREAIESMHPTTGDALVFFVDELDSFEVVR